MAVITLASPKGGCGKSTTAIVLAGQYAEQGYKVRIIDADPKKRILRWASAGTISENISVVEANAGSLVNTLRLAEEQNDVVLIDVEHDYRDGDWARSLRRDSGKPLRGRR